MATVKSELNKGAITMKISLYRITRRDGSTVDTSASSLEIAKGITLKAYPYAPESAIKSIEEIRVIYDSKMTED